MSNGNGLGPKTPWTIQTAYLILLITIVFAAGGAYVKACDHLHDDRYTPSAIIDAKIESLSDDVEETRSDVKVMREILEARYGRHE